MPTGASYTVLVTFPGYDPFEAGTVEIPADRAVDLSCDSFIESCSLADAKPREPETAPAPEPASEPDETAEDRVNVEVAVRGMERLLFEGEPTEPGGPPSIYAVPGTVPTGGYILLAPDARRTGECYAEWGPEPTSVSVQLEGAAAATLTNASGTFAVPGTLPPGTYALAVDGRNDVLGDLTIDALGGTISCTDTSCALARPDAQPVDVTLGGDASGASLVVNGDTIALPAKVPPGDWPIVASFDFGTETVERTLAAVSVGAGRSAEIYCSRANAGAVFIESDATELDLWCDPETPRCIEDSGWWNPWRGAGQVPLALLSMVAVGFLGASLATRERRHLTIDAIDRVLSPRPAAFVKRLSSLASAILCGILARATLEQMLDPHTTGSGFPSSAVYWWMTSPLNAVVDWLPGFKYGPGTDFLSREAWTASTFPAGLPTELPLAWSYVQSGDEVPMWVAWSLLLFAFAVMALRFFFQFLRPAKVDPGPAPRPGTRRPADVILAGLLPGALIALGLAWWLGAGPMVIVGAVLLILLGSPLFVGVGFGTLAGWLLFTDADAGALVSDMRRAAEKQEIIAIPFFVLAGNIMTNGAIARRLVAFARALVQPIPGGLGVAAVLACAVFAAISGSSPATVIAIGSIMFPMLVRQGYSERFSLGMLSTAGSLGIIIPPSVPMIIYAVIVSKPVYETVGIEVTPTQLFTGGVVPGLFIAAILVLYTFYVNWPRAIALGASGGGATAVRGSTSPNEDDFEDGPYFPVLGRAFLRAIPSLMLPLLILGGIWGWFELIGIPLRFNVTAAAAVAVIYALVIELFVHRQMGPRDVWDVCVETALMIGSLFLILIIAISLNKLLASLGIPEAATEWMLSWTTSDVTFLLAVTVFLLILGCLMDIISAILIVAPLLAPIAATYGIHPIHFGILFIVNLEIGYLTPPLGINLFVAATTFDRSILKVVRSILPFLLVMLFCLLAITWGPYFLQRTLGIQVPGLPSCITDDAGLCLDAADLEKRKR